MDSGSNTGPIEDRTRPGKTLISGNEIEAGAIGLQHLSPGLYQEIRKITLHGHTGVGSVPIKLGDLTNSFPKEGFQMRDSSGKVWTVTVSTGGILVVS